MNEIVEKISGGMKQKYRCFLEIERITRELSDALSTDDRGTAQILLELRQNEMEKAEEAQYSLKELLYSLEPGERERFAELMNGRTPLDQVKGLEREIVQMAGQTENVLSRILFADKNLSQKLAGKDSYYR